MILRRRKPEWRHEPGPGYDLRQYENGRPTGFVAVVSHVSAATAPWIAGPDVRLVRERSRLVVEEHRSRSGAPAALLRIPLRACVGAELSTELGLPGSALIRLTLTFRVGRRGTATVPLWFPAQGRPFLQTIVNEIDGRATPATPSEPGPPSPPRPPILPRLLVRGAPDDDNWLVFRSVDNNEVVSSETDLPSAPAAPSAGGPQ